MITRPKLARLVVAVTIGASLLAACTPPPPPTPQQQIDQIIAFVEAVRGHPFPQRPEVTFLDDASFRAAVLAAVAEAEPDVDVAEVAFRALGWIAPTADLFDLYQIAFGGGVVGFYNPETGELVVRGTELTPYRREVIAHELTHALDDQLFGLDEDFGDGLLGERTFAALVAIEGSAERVRQAYFGSMTGLEQVASILEQLTAGADPALLSVPLALLTFTQAPYLRGPAFLSELIGAVGSAGAVDDALTRYPATAEQAFDVAKYLSEEAAVPVPTPPADGPVVWSGSWGQFLLTLLLNNGLALDQVDARTNGWAGDAAVTWTNGTQSCLRLDTRMDTATQADTLRAGLQAWAVGRNATVSPLDPETVRLSVCA
jgi:hypothetical protein